MKIVKTIISLLILWLLGHIWFMMVDGLVDKEQPADLAVVFGSKVNEDGTLSERLQARLDQAVLLYQQQRVKAILVSGGLGQEGFWEGDKMKEYLLTQQIPQAIILVDNYGDNSEKTVRNAAQIMQQYQYQSALSVSQYFHQVRTKMLFRTYGIENIESSTPMYFELRDIYSVLREFPAFYKDLVRAPQEKL